MNNKCPKCAEKHEMEKLESVNCFIGNKVVQQPNSPSPYTYGIKIDFIKRCPECGYTEIYTKEI